MKQIKYGSTLILFSFIAGMACVEQHTPPPAVVVPAAQPPIDTAQKSDNKNLNSPDKNATSSVSSDTFPPSPTQSPKNTAATSDDIFNPVVPIAPARNPLAPTSSDASQDKKDIIAKAADLPGSDAVDAAEAAARSSLGKGVQPPGSQLSYTSEDEPRIQYYKLFVAGTLGTNDVVRLLFKDSNFNRAVEVMGDLYQQDKMAGKIPPDVDVKFQELGQKVGNAVLIYNQRKRSAHYSKLVGSVAIGTLIGGMAGGVLVKDEWVPEIISTKFGARIPGYVRNGIVAGAATGGVVLVSMEAYRIINEFAHPNLIYNADPLLDMPIKN